MSIVEPPHELNRRRRKLRGQVLQPLEHWRRVAHSRKGSAACSREPFEAFLHRLPRPYLEHGVLRPPCEPTYEPGHNRTGPGALGILVGGVLLVPDRVSGSGRNGDRSAGARARARLREDFLPGDLPPRLDLGDYSFVELQEPTTDLVDLDGSS